MLSTPYRYPTFDTFDPMYCTVLERDRCKFSNAVSLSHHWHDWSAYCTVLWSSTQVKPLNAVSLSHHWHNDWSYVLYCSWSRVCKPSTTYRYPNIDTFDPTYDAILWACKSISSQRHIAIPPLIYLFSIFSKHASGPKRPMNQDRRRVQTALASTAFCNPHKRGKRENT